MAVAQSLRYETFAPAECGCVLCDPDAYGSPPGMHPGGLPVIGDYPSVWDPPHHAPPYLLLDTCVVQNLRWAREHAPAVGDRYGWDLVYRRFGPRLGSELRAIASLRVGIEGVESDESTPCPFVVTLASWQELLQAPGERGIALRREWRYWRRRTQSFGDLGACAPHPLFTRMPEELGWPSPGQASLPGLEDLGSMPSDALGPFRDPGDRQLIREALHFDIPAILTTDLKTFWRHRNWLFAHGVEVWRPAHLCWLLLSDFSLWRGEGVNPHWPGSQLTETVRERVESIYALTRPRGPSEAAVEIFAAVDVA